MIRRAPESKATRFRRRATGVAVALAIGVPASAQEPPDGGDALTSLNRLLRVFDFEEAETAPYSMPINFYRFVAPDRGFPAFGSLTLTDEVSFRGRWSFEFTLAGGSMSARVPTAVLPVLPTSDYTVSVWVRTSGLEQGRAGLVAELHDIRGDLVPGTRVESQLVQTRGAWRQLSVYVHGDDDRAADLVVELQVLQPGQFTNLEARVDRPMLQDVSGRVWFDDLAVWQRPRLEMTTGAPGNVIGPDEPRTLNLLIRDPTLEQLTATLTIRDLTGASVREMRFEPSHGAWHRTINLDDLPGGWYGAELHVRQGTELIHYRRLDLVICPPGDRRQATGGHLGVALSGDAALDTAASIELVRRIGAETAVVPLTLPQTPMDQPISTDLLVSGLLADGVEVTLSLSRAPDVLAQQVGVSPFEVLSLLNDERGQWAGLLDGIGQDTVGSVSRWLLGAPGMADSVSSAKLRSMVRGAQRSLANIVPGPVILVPSWIEGTNAPLPHPHQHWLYVPYEARPETIAALASRWVDRDEPAAFATTLERLPTDAYSSLERVGDLMARALSGWKSGLTRMTIEAPWNKQPRQPIMPDAEFAAWRVLAEVLPGRSFGGEIPLADGVRAWVLDGTGSDDALVVWNERADDPLTIPIMLANNHVEQIDAGGNRTVIPLIDGVHHLPVGRLPSFIEGIDGNLARFRAGFAIEPAFIPARRQMHEARIVLANPWNQTIFGTLSLDPEASWRLAPRVQRFVVGPGESTTIPIEFLFDRGVISGPTEIAAIVELNADQQHTLTMRTWITVGLDYLDVSAYWRAIGEDIVVGVNVTNLGQEPRDLFCKVSGPGISHHRRPIVGLIPGLTAQRNFHLAGARQTLENHTISVTVSESDGNGRVTQMLHVTPQGSSVVSGE